MNAALDVVSNVVSNTAVQAVVGATAVQIASTSPASATLTLLSAVTLLGTTTAAAANAVQAFATAGAAAV